VVPGWLPAAATTTSATTAATATSATTASTTAATAHAAPTATAASRRGQALISAAAEIPCLTSPVLP